MSSRRSDVLPSVTVEQMMEVDRIMVEEWGIGLLQMMEHAGRNLTEVARIMLGGELSRRKIVVLVGPGNNGGGGLVAARHLANGGASVVVILAQDLTRLREIPAHQHATFLRIGVRSVIFNAEDADELAACLGPADLVIDALLGYSLNGPPRGAIAALIRQVNRSGRPILALDLPSGLHPDAGEPLDPCIRAHTTLTLALPKQGLLVPAAKPYVGRLWVGDLGVPPEIYKRVGLDVGPLFSRAPVIPLEEEEPDAPARRYPAPANEQKGR
jgi:NAD(P)H-hydrate epimerase